MRIAVSGTHASGKTTLVEDFLERHPDYAHEPEPYEWLDETPAVPIAEDFLRQLEISVERLGAHKPGTNVIAERSPLDFVAYLHALHADDATLEAATSLAAEGMQSIDLLVVLPLNPAIHVPEDEDPDLREAMNDHLLELVDGTDVPVIEITGTRAQRLRALEATLSSRP